MTHRLVLRHLSAIPHKEQYTANVVIYHPAIWRRILAATQAPRVNENGEGARVRLWRGALAAALAAPAVALAVPAVAVPAVAVALAAPAVALAAPAVAVPALAAPVYGRVLVGYTENAMRDFPKGAEVVVVGTLKAYAEFKDLHGVVALTLKQHHRTVCVRLESQDAREAVQRLNALPHNRSSLSFLKDDQLDLLCCKVGQVRQVRLRDGGKDAQDAQDAPGGGSDSTRLGKRKALDDLSQAEALLAAGALVQLSRN